MWDSNSRTQSFEWAKRVNVLDGMASVIGYCSYWHFLFSGGKKVKISLLQAIEAHRVARG
jgi:hypothetical protein